MRVEFKFTAKNTASLDLNYNILLNALIYKKIGEVNKRKSKELHEKKGFKLFTFSNLFIENRVVYKSKMIVNRGSQIKWYFSSIDEGIFESLVKGMLISEKIELGNLELSLVDVKILSYNLNKDVFDTLSPIITTKTIENRRIDLKPTQEDFFNNLKENLIKKYNSIFRKNAPFIHIEPSRQTFIKPKRIKIKNTYFIGYIMKNLILIGDEKIKQVALDCGLGEKNSMGMGMIV